VARDDAVVLVNVFDRDDVVPIEPEMPPTSSLPSEKPMLALTSTPFVIEFVTLFCHERDVVWPVDIWVPTDSLKLPPQPEQEATCTQ